MAIVKHSNSLPRLMSMLPLALLIVGGCVPDTTSSHPYSPAPGESIPVPPGARLIAYGHYPLATFTPPHEAGSLYIYDEDSRKVAFITNYLDGAASAIDLNQLSKNSFDPNHSYRVYYIPAAAALASQPAVEH